MKKILGLMAVLLSSTALADGLTDGHFYAGAGMGRGRIALNPAHTGSGSHDAFDTVGPVLSGGYAFKMGPVVEASYGTYATKYTFNYFDNYWVDEAKLMVGWSISLGDFLYVIPKVGMNWWALQVHPGAVDHLGIDKTTTFRGSARVWEVDIEVPLTERFHPYIGYSKINYDYGQIQNTRLGLNYVF